MVAVVVVLGCGLVTLARVQDAVHGVGGIT